MAAGTGRGGGGVGARHLGRRFSAPGRRGKRESFPLICDPFTFSGTPMLPVRKMLALSLMYALFPAAQAQAQTATMAPDDVEATELDQVTVLGSRVPRTL